MLFHNPAQLLKQFPEHVSLNDCQLPKLEDNLKGYIRTLSSNPKIYKENCLLMQIAKVLSPTTDRSNICYKVQSSKESEKKYSIVGVICKDDDYFLLPRCRINAFKNLTRLCFNVIMLPDIAVYKYHQDQDPKTKDIWMSNGKMDQRNAFKYLSEMKNKMITPLLIIEEESSTMRTTAQSLAAKLIEQFRLMRAQKSSVTQVTGFAFPPPKSCDFESISLVAVDAGDNPVEGGVAEGENTVVASSDLNQSTVEANFNIGTPQVQAPHKRDHTGEPIIRTAPTKVVVSWDSIFFSD